MDVKIEESWKKVLHDEFGKDYFKQLASFVKAEYVSSIVYPPPKDIFRAFNLTPFNEVKVVILGQDPYHGPKQANGLCFAVHSEVPAPPSLQNIFKEISAECSVPYESLLPKKNLESWAKQGVLLLNATLTVRARTAGSHQHKGWEEFTDAVVKKLSEEREHLAFMLWGNYARSKGAHIDRSKHLVLESAHPSPFSAHSGFLGNGHFIKTNAYLSEYGKTPIDWVT